MKRTVWAIGILILLAILFGAWFVFKDKAAEPSGKSGQAFAVEMWILSVKGLQLKQTTIGLVDTADMREALRKVLPSVDLDSSDVELLTAPRVTTLAGEWAKISTGTEIPYNVPTPDGKEKEERVFVGTVAKIKAKSLDDKGVALDWDVYLSWLDPAELPESSSARHVHPAMTERSWKNSTVVPLGQTTVRVEPATDFAYVIVVRVTEAEQVPVPR